MNCSQDSIIQLIDRVRSVGTQNSRLVISIIGASASGKTTVASRLHEALGEDSVLVSQDLFQLGKDFDGRKTSLYKWDDPRNFALDECGMFLHQLKSGLEAEAPGFDVVQNRRLEPVSIQPRDFIIWEGVYANLTQDLRGLTDISVYVDTPFIVRLIRRISRFIESRPVGPDVDYTTPARQMLTFVLRAEMDIARGQQNGADLLIKFDESGINLEIETLMRSLADIPGSYKLVSSSPAVTRISRYGLEFVIKQDFLEIYLNEQCVYGVGLQKITEIEDEYIFNDEAIDYITNM